MQSPQLVWCLGIGYQDISFSCQVEHLQEYESYLSLGLLTWHPRQEWLNREPRNLFQQTRERNEI